MNISSYLWHEAMEGNIRNIESLIQRNPRARVLDVGCGDGQVTVQYREKIGTRELSGIDGQKERVLAARTRGIDAKLAVLEEKWPYPNNSFDVIITNQVIEHVIDIDHFISETYRILKKGGYSIVSTENLASWHSIGALILGYQDFSHHILKKKHIGNPFALHYWEKTATWSKNDNSGVDDSAFPHIKIMTYKSLIQAYRAYDFVFEEGRGSGYYPLFGKISAFASLIDPVHSHFIAIKVRK